MDPDKAIYEYGVSFDPPIHEIDVRSKLLNQHQGKIGTLNTFDGETLYLPFLIVNTVRFFFSYIFKQKMTFSFSPIDFKEFSSWNQYNNHGEGYLAAADAPICSFLPRSYERNIPYYWYDPDRGELFLPKIAYSAAIWAASKVCISL